MKAGFRIHVIIWLVAVLLLLVQMTRSGVLFNTNHLAHIDAPVFNLDVASHLSTDEIGLYQQNNCLVIHDKSIEILKNVETVLATLKIDFDVMPASGHKDDYQVYDLIILIETDRYVLADHDLLLQYVRTGGKLIYLGNGSNGSRDILQVDAKFLGIKQTGPIRETNTVFFTTELLTGITGMIEITGEYMTPYKYFQSIDVNLDSDCQIHLESGDGNPLIWEKDQMNGGVMVLNVGRAASKEIRGLIAGSIAVFKDILIYPVIGSEVVFIDDFPADYHADSEILRVSYGRDLQRFILEIWWPQMLNLMRRYNLKYTGAYIEHYNNQVDGLFAANKSIQKASASLVNDLLSHFGEVSLHGYNHQPLFYNQARMDLYGYKAWPGSSQIVDALEQSVQFFNLMFPRYRFYTYVPPSNILDSAAIAALKHAVPSLRVISGVYYGEADEDGVANPDDFDQEFGLDERYGIALPRVSSGGFLTDEVRYMIASAVTTNGIVNHFVHPDDVLDFNRSKGMKWEELYDEYDTLFHFLDQTYGWLSEDTASEAAGKLEQVAHAKIYYSETRQKITIACDHFGNTISLMVASDQPISAGANCSVQKIDSIRYLVVMQASKITLEVGQP